MINVVHDKITRKSSDGNVEQKRKPPKTNVEVSSVILIDKCTSRNR